MQATLATRASNPQHAACTARTSCTGTQHVRLQGIMASLSRILASVGVGVAHVSWLLQSGPGGLHHEEVGKVPPGATPEAADAAGVCSATGKPALKSARFHVGGMSCASCVASLESVLGAVAGVAGCSVSLLGEEAVVEFDPTQCVVADLKQAIEDVGFEATLRVQVSHSCHVGVTPGSQARRRLSQGCGWRGWVCGWEGR